ncbi:hypothetical protein GQ473_06235 [archaeon]|nr:hypothetical protein [archaeon]
MDFKSFFWPTGEKTKTFFLLIFIFAVLARFFGWVFLIDALVFIISLETQVIFNLFSSVELFKFIMFGIIIALTITLYFYLITCVIVSFKKKYFFHEISSSFEINSELSDWLKKQFENGNTNEQIEQTLRNNNYDDDTIKMALYPERVEIETPIKKSLKRKNIFLFLLVLILFFVFSTKYLCFDDGYCNNINHNIDVYFFQKQAELYKITLDEGLNNPSQAIELCNTLKKIESVDLCKYEIALNLELQNSTMSKDICSSISKDILRGRCYEYIIDIYGSSNELKQLVSDYISLSKTELFFDDKEITIVFHYDEDIDEKYMSIYIDGRVVTEGIQKTDVNELTLKTSNVNLFNKVFELKIVKHSEPVVDYVCNVQNRTCSMN